MPEHSEHRGHSRGRDRENDNRHRNSHNYRSQRGGDDRRRGDERIRDREETREDEDDSRNEKGTSSRVSRTEAPPNFTRLSDAMNHVLEEVRGVKQEVTGIRGELNTTEQAVLELKNQVSKPAQELKATEDVSKTVEPAKPAESPKPATPAPVSTPSKSFFDVVGDGFKMIGEIPGKIVRTGIKLALTPFAAAAKVIEGFWKGLTTPLFGPPKKTA